MLLEKFQSLNDGEDKIIAAIAILGNTKNAFANSVILQWQRGCTLSLKQRLHLYLLAEQQLTSIARGYSGIDHGYPIELPHKTVTNYGEAINNKKHKLKIRFKHKYRIGDIQPLLDMYGIKAQRTANQEGKLGWIVGGDWYETLREFVVWACDEDPTHPLAGGIVND